MTDIVERLRDQYHETGGVAILLLAADEIERLRREQTDPTDPESKAWQFQEVMACMHGDGGHYLATHGPRKAADDAMARHYRLVTDNERLRARLAEAERALCEILETDKSSPNRKDCHIWADMLETARAYFYGDTDEDAP